MKTQKIAGNLGRIVPAPPSQDVARQILRAVVLKGNLLWGGAFKRKCGLRKTWPGFNSVDATKIVKRALIILGPVYNGDFHAWQFQLGDYVEGRKFALEVLLHCDADYEESPTVTVLSGNYRKWKLRE